MSLPIVKSIIERLEDEPYSAMPSGNVVIPFHDDGVHFGLVNEAALCVGRHAGGDLVIVTDSETASKVPSLNELRGRAARVFIIGKVPRHWGAADNVAQHTGGPVVMEQDRLFVMLSSTVSVAVLGSESGGRREGDLPYHGGWVLDRPYVRKVMGILTGGESKDLLEGMPESPEWTAPMSELAMRLMNLHANALATRQQDIAVEKGDLSSVLNILKAISAKRRAHDILFVFVEQIARVVSSDRCSVVRIWGSKKTGQVLASHEDASVADREIELDKYPELLRSISSGEKVIVNDVYANTLTKPIAPLLKQAQIHSLLVIPIVLHDPNVGSLLLRAARRKGSFSLREISFFEIVSEAASNALERAHLFESIQAANETLERLAITDGLTDLYNHRYFRERLQHEVERAQRYRLPLACMIYDVDNFKVINDTFGHIQGDQVLKEIAARTHRCIRKSDIVARYGGEEFVVIMPQTDIEGGMAQGERVRAIIASEQFPGEPAPIPVTVSVGVGVFDHDNMHSGEDLLRQADQALYEAKGTGKNKVVGPSPAMGEKSE